MANYSRVFGSDFPNNLLTLSGFKDISEATSEVKELIKQFYTFMDTGNLDSASALLEANYTLLRPYYMGMEWANKMEEDVYNTQVFALQNNYYVISDTEPNTSDHPINSIWLKPLD